MDVDKYIKNFPVYQLLGDDVQQQNFLQYLREELVRHKLTYTVFYKDQEEEIYTVLSAVRQYDLVLLTAPVPYDVKQIRLDSGKTEKSNLQVGPGSKTFRSRECFLSMLKDMTKSLSENPVWACVLIGGKSSRMGQPKHLLKDKEGRTWLENTVESIKPFVAGVVLSGKGEVPPTLQHMLRLPDIPGVVGPLNGILSAGRWQPHVSWVLTACDMPGISGQGVDWLLADRSPGCWGRIPKLEHGDFYEPLFAWYDFRALTLFEKQLLQGNYRIGSIANHEKIENPAIPKRLCNNWQNVNTPDQLHSLYK